MRSAGGAPAAARTLSPTFSDQTLCFFLGGGWCEPLPVSQTTGRRPISRLLCPSAPLCPSLEEESGLSGFIYDIKPFRSYFSRVRRPTTPLIFPSASLGPQHSRRDALFHMRGTSSGKYPLSATQRHLLSMQQFLDFILVSFCSKSSYRRQIDSVRLLRTLPSV